MKNIVRISALLSLPILIASCQTTKNVGEGDIYFFTDNFVAQYNNYISTIRDYPRHSFAFVLDKKTGAAGWAGRPSLNGVGYAISMATDNCRLVERAKNCAVFDINGKVVWKGLNEDRKHELVSYANRDLGDRENKVVKYNADTMTLGAKQIQNYNQYLKTQDNYDVSTFFVSANGFSTGKAGSTGTTDNSTTLRNGLKSCQLQSETSKCYLFAMNGKPVNAAARTALKQ